MISTSCQSLVSCVSVAIPNRQAKQCHADRSNPPTSNDGVLGAHTGDVIAVFYDRIMYNLNGAS